MESIRLFDNFVIIIDYKTKSEIVVSYEDIHIIKKDYLKGYEFFYIVYVKTIHLPDIKKLDYIAEIVYISSKEYEQLLNSLNKYKNIR